MSIQYKGKRRSQGASSYNSPLSVLVSSFAIFNCGGLLPAVGPFLRTKVLIKQGNV